MPKFTRLRDTGWRYSVVFNSTQATLGLKVIYVQHDITGRKVSKFTKS